MCMCMFKYYMRTKKLKVICARVTFEIRRQPHRVKCEIRYASEHTKKPIAAHSLAFPLPQCSVVYDTTPDTGP